MIAVGKGGRPSLSRLTDTPAQSGAYFYVHTYKQVIVKTKQQQASLPVTDPCEL